VRFHLLALSPGHPGKNAMNGTNKLRAAPLRLLRRALRNPGVKRLARAVIIRIPFLRRRVYALLAGGVFQQREYDGALPVTAGDLSPRTARSLRALAQAARREQN
jgi:hypothetical protein